MNQKLTDLRFVIGLFLLIVGLIVFAGGEPGPINRFGGGLFFLVGVLMAGSSFIGTDK
jgi:hypothetical protein